MELSEPPRQGCPVCEPYIVRRCIFISGQSGIRNGQTGSFNIIALTSRRKKRGIFPPLQLIRLERLNFHEEGKSMLMNSVSAKKGWRQKRVNPGSRGHLLPRAKPWVPGDLPLCPLLLSLWDLKPCSSKGIFFFFFRIAHPHFFPQKLSWELTSSRKPSQLF